MIFKRNEILFGLTINIEAETQYSPASQLLKTITFSRATKKSSSIVLYKKIIV